jgi:hypothetical protein
MKASKYPIYVKYSLDRVKGILNMQFSIKLRITFAVKQIKFYAKYIFSIQFFRAIINFL